MMGYGIKATELIKQLQAQIAIHGDCEVWCGGGDYPEGVKTVTFTIKGNTYIPAGSFKL